jgi:Flp pilus assembly protein TadD
LGRLDEAVTSFHKALNIQPDYTQAHSNLGNVFKELGRLDEAVESYHKALAIKPDLAEAHYNLGATFQDLGKLDEAVASYHKALAIKLDYAEAHYNLGNALKDLWRLHEAIASYNKALAIKPDYVEAHSNLGNVFKELGRLDEAVESYHKALAIKPDYAGAHVNLGLLQLLMGDFQNGWRNYAWRWRAINSPLRPREYEEPFWDGGDLEGKTVFIYPEQGLGDFIQFTRYVPLTAKKGGRVVVEVPKVLHCLFSSLEGANMVIETGQPPGHFDLHASLLDLPKTLGTTLQTIPARESYLEAPSELIEKWKIKLAIHEGIHVGIVWGGNPDHKSDKMRSIDPILFKPLLEFTGVTFFSLQVGRNGEALETFGSQVVDLRSEATPFDDTAAVMMNMDLIISVDTSLAHLAGALGRPVWTLLSFVPDWRWMLDRDDSPWYPTMRLIRQQECGAWEGVIRKVCQDLEEQLGNTQE